MSELLLAGVERFGRETPDAPAVIDRDRTLSYGDLNRDSGQIAGLLAALGVGRGERVGLYLDKSYEAVAGIYGILKAGAAYVPLDPRAPAARLAGVVADCGLRVLLTGTDRLAQWAEVGAGTDALVVLDADADAFAAPDLGATSLHSRSDMTAAAPPPAAAVGDDDLAYVLYTSGSTGVPKGVMLSHRNGRAFVQWAVDAIGISSTDRLSSHAPFHFDLSVLDLYAASLVGAPMAIVPRTASLFPVELASFIDRVGITVWYSVPSILTMLIERGGLTTGALPSLRRVVFAGEVFPVKYLRRLMDLLPHAEFWNLYGPTETNVCTALKVESPVDPEGPDITIGSAIAGVDTVVVTDDGRRAAPGEEGELIVAGPTVMHGYWGDTAKTAARLVVDPLGDGDPRPYYRTGDIVAEQPDGNYKFLGRRDSQVKTRGHRVELGEIETALYSHPGVKECAAVAVPDPMVTNRLHAFVVLNAGVEMDELTGRCAERLPTYMVPERITVVDAMPRTSTGKVDRRALLDSLET